MGAYDSRKFSKEFSERTKANLQFVDKVVNKEELLESGWEEFIQDYNDIIKKFISIENEIKHEAAVINRVQKKRKNSLGSELYSLSDTLAAARKKLERVIEEIDPIGTMQGDKLYEVTQLINSLMGIAVLPYEMHKEFFRSIEDKYKTNDYKGKTLSEIQNEVRDTIEYDNLKKYILRLYREKKWRTTYYDDLYRRDNSVKEEIVVFRFLYHLRNAICHSGDNALSILPLEEGKVIKEVLFYDSDGEQEFALRLKIDELEDLVKYVSDFYGDTIIGKIDKTDSIKNAEKRVMELLKIT